MSKSKPTTKVSKKDATEGVKAGRVTKPEKKSTKATGKSAKAIEEIKKVVKKKDVSSSSESDSDSDDSSSSESEVEEKKQQKVAATNGKKSKAKKAESSSESSSESESGSDSSGSDSGSDASDSDAEDSSSEESSEEEKPKAKATKAAPAVNGKATKAEKKAVVAAPAADDTSDSSESSESEDAASESGSDSDSDAGSDSSSDSDEEEEASEDEEEAEKPAKKAEPAVNGNKRKAADEAETPAKKSKVEESGESASLFVGNLSWNVDKDWLTSEFEEFGTVTGCRIITDKDSGRSKGYGYIDFSTAEEAKAAQAARHGHFLDGRDLRVDFATPRPDRPQDSPAAFRDRANSRAQRFGDNTSAPTQTLWVGNLPYGTDEDSIKEGFAEYGSITRVGLPRDRETGEIKGIAYVSFEDVEQAKAALEALNGTDFNGRPLRLDYDKGRDDSAGGFGGRGGRGGFGDRGGRGGFGGRGGRGGFGDRGGRGGGFGGRGGGRGGFGGRGRGGPPNTTNRGGFGDFKGQKVSFDD